MKAANAESAWSGGNTAVGPMRAARYVIEVAAGTSRREGLEIGNRLTILAEPPLP